MTQDQTERTERNVQAIVELEERDANQVSWFNKFAGIVARFSGTVTFIFIHVIFFTFWITFNTFMIKDVDPYPFTFLTMTVSLESIFLAAFVMISQNSLSDQSERRHKLDLQINMLAEQENTALMRVIFKMGQKLQLAPEELKELQMYIEDTDPEQMLEQIKSRENQTLSAT